MPLNSWPGESRIATRRSRSRPRPRRPSRRRSGSAGDVVAVAVGAEVRVRAQELVQQVAVGGVKLDPVGAGRHGPPRRLDVRVAHLGELARRDLARRHVVEVSDRRAHRALVAQRGRRDRRHATGVDRVRDAPAVHELYDELRVTRGVDRVGDPRPPLLLHVVVEPGDVEVPLPHRIRMRPLGDEDRGARPLRVVRRVELAGDRRRRPVAGQRRHRDPVREAQAASLVGLEEVGERHDRESSGPLRLQSSAPCARPSCRSGGSSCCWDPSSRSALCRSIRTCLRSRRCRGRSTRAPRRSSSRSRPASPASHSGSFRGPAQRQARAPPADPRRALLLRRRVAALRGRAGRPHAHRVPVRAGLRGRGGPRHRAGGRAGSALRRRGGAAVLVAHAHHRRRPDPRPCPRRADPRADVVAGDLRGARGHRGRGAPGGRAAPPGDAGARAPRHPRPARHAADAAQPARQTGLHGLRGRLEPLVRHRLRVRLRLVVRPAGHLRAVAAALQRGLRLQRDRAHHLQPGSTPGSRAGSTPR